MKCPLCGAEMNVLHESHDAPGVGRRDYVCPQHPGAIERVMWNCPFIPEMNEDKSPPDLDELRKKYLG